LNLLWGGGREGSTHYHGGYHTDETKNQRMAKRYMISVLKSERNKNVDLCSKKLR